MAVSAYEVISTQTLDSAISSVTFGSIPQTYTDLVLVAREIVSADGETRLNFNSDTGTNYSSTLLWGQGVSAYSFRYTSITGAFAGYSYASGIKTTIINLQNYSNTTTNKTLICRASESGTEAMLTSSLWRNTAAISTIAIGRTAGNFSISSVFTLYGIKAA
jgi:hypothetical protein